MSDPILSPSYTPPPLSTPAKIILSSTSLGITGSTLGSVIALRQNLPIARSAFVMGANWWLVSGCFFSVREFAVVPLVKKGEVEVGKDTWWGGVGETAVSAATVGGFFAGVTRGKQVISRAATTSSVICIALQLSFNQLSTLLFLQPSPSTSTPTSSSPQPILTSPSNTPHDLPAAGDRSPFWGKLIPMSKIPDEEWAGRLRRDLQVTEVRLKDVERELEREELVLKNLRGESGSVEAVGVLDGDGKAETKGRTLWRW